MFLKLTQKSAVTTHHYHFPTAEEPLFKTGQHIKPLGSGSQKKTSCPWGVMQVVLNTPCGEIMYERLQVGVNKTHRNHSISSLDVCHEVLTKLLWVWGSFITDILSVYQLWVPHWDPLSPWSCPLKHRQLSQLSTPLGISMKGHATRRSHDNSTSTLYGVAVANKCIFPPVITRVFCSSASTVSLAPSSPSRSHTD